MTCWRFVCISDSAVCGYGVWGMGYGVSAMCAAASLTSNCTRDRIHCSPMNLNYPSLLFALTACTVAAFVLTIVGADVGAPEQNKINALCSVAVLGAMTFTAFVASRRPD